MKKKFKKLTKVISFSLSLCALLLFPLLSYALSSDRDQPINLEADHADIDDLQGISIYTGNVILTQGSTEIKCHKLTLYMDENRQLSKAIAEGKDKLATYKQRPDGKDQDFKARAASIIYYLTTDQIHLLKQATVWQGGDRFSGDKIIYNTAKDTVVASSKKDKHGNAVGDRIRVTIQPRKE
jgi:lipopolysaccharide export system protein LptA